MYRFSDQCSRLQVVVLGMLVEEEPGSDSSGDTRDGVTLQNKAYVDSVGGEPLPPVAPARQ